MDTQDTQPNRAGAPSTPAGPHGRSPLARRTLAWAIMAICGALLVATLSEAWTRSNVEAQVAAAQAQNAALQREVTATQHAVQQAQSDAAVEREARSWGYIRSGDHPIIIVVSSK